MKLASLFTDHAVLQRNKAVPVWGTTLPDVPVGAEIAGKSAWTRSSRTGEFMLRLPELAPGGPWQLRVFAPQDPEEEILLSDILIGDVWIAGGQSNMQYKLGDDFSVEHGLPREKRKRTVNLDQCQEFCDTICENDEIRAVTVPMENTMVRERAFNARWEKVDREHAPLFTAVGLWFARTIRRETGVPVGIISCNWGGTVVQTWISRAGLLSCPETAMLPGGNDRIFALKKTWEEPPVCDGGQVKFARVTKTDPGNKGFALGYAECGFDDETWKEYQIPGSWITQKISGNGSVWIRKRLFLPEKWQGKQLILHTGGIDKHDIAYFNGKEIGRTGKDFEECWWDQLRAYPVPAELTGVTECTVALRGYSFFFDGGFKGREEEWFLEEPVSGETLPLAGVWKANAELDFGVLTPASASVGINTPGVLFDGMLRPLLPCAIAGVIWYQGESNATYVAEASGYLSMITTLIRDWRYHFEQGDFPFIQVQLANYRAQSAFDSESAWALLRDAQRQVCTRLPEVYLTSAVDLGEENDIHPQDKKSVGERLAQTVLYHLYRKNDAVPSGPAFHSFRQKENGLELRFSYAKGMHFSAPEARGFFIAGPSRKFYPAQTAEITGDCLFLASSEVSNPIAVRYAWADNPDGNLCGENGLPAVPFRTDNWNIQ